MTADHSPWFSQPCLRSPWRLPLHCERQRKQAQLGTDLQVSRKPLRPLAKKTCSILCSIRKRDRRGYLEQVIGQRKAIPLGLKMGQCAPHFRW